MGEKTYRVKNIFTGDKIDVPENLIPSYRDATEEFTGKRLYEFLDDVPGGALKLSDGSIKEYTIPKDRVHETASEHSQFLLPAPGLKERAAKDEHFRKLKQAAEDTPASAVAIRSFMSGMTGGASTAAVDSFHNEDYQQIRQMAMDDKKLAHFTGRAGSLLALGMLPIGRAVPALGKVGGALVPSLRGAKNVDSIFSLGAAFGSKAMGPGTKGAGFVADFWRRFKGSMAFGATTEVPLSMAMASADIVDHNQDYTAQAVASNFMSQWGFAMALTVPGAAAFSAIGAGVRSASRPMLRAADDYLGAEVKALAAGTSQQELLDSGIRGLIRYSSRKGLRGRYLGLGDIIETQAYKIGRRLVKGQGGMKPSETRIGRWLGGSDLDDYIRYDRANKEAIVSLTEGTTSQVRESADVLLHSVRDPELVTALNFVRSNAETMVPGKRAAQELVMDAGKFADDILKTQIRPRRGMSPLGKVKVDQELRTALDQVGMSNKPIRKNYMKAAEDTLNLRRLVPPGQKREIIDAALERSFKVKNIKGGDVPDGLRTFLRNLDEIDAAAKDIKANASRLAESGADGVGIRSAWEIIGSADDATTTPGAFRSIVKRAEGNFRALTDKKVNALADTKPFFSGERPAFVTKGKQTLFTINTRLNDMRAGLDALGTAHRVQGQLMADATPLFRAAKPTTQTERLAAQVETVIDTKRSIQAALMFAAVRGGAARHTAVFGGVYAFRSLSTLAEKRDTFVAYRDAVVQNASNPEALQAHVGSLVEGAAAEDMGLGAALAANQMTAYGYLAQQLPRSSDPMIGPEDFSTSEMENWLEALGAVMQPISVIATSSDGSVSSQGVDAFRTVYPELYIDAVVDVAEFVAEYGPKLDHATLLGLDAFTGGALGYSDGPAPNLTYRVPGYQTAAQAASAGATGGPENRRMDIQQNTTPAQKVGAL